MKNWILFFLPLFCLGQTDSLKIDYGCFLDTYYSYDFANPKGNQKLPFLYNYNRHNEFAVNLALLKTKITYQNMYATIALHAGTYVQDNYVNEPIQYINEAFVGVYLDKLKKHSVEVGVLPSYIGFESVTTLNNLTLTRSLLADNSPYFMTGLWYRYNLNSRWSIGALLTNGWQRIQKPVRSVQPAIGSQISYKPSTKHTLNWSSYAGKEQYDTFSGMRWFENIFWDAQWNANWHTIIGFDIGFQDTPSGYKSWCAPVAITQYNWSSSWQMAFRLEYYSDPNQMMVALGKPFLTWGSSLNLDYTINKYCKYRIETRYLTATESLFNNRNTNLCFTTGLLFGF